MTDIQRPSRTGWLMRRRLDVPEVHVLLRACDRMLDDWAETEPGSADRRRMWRDVHRAADAVSELTYGQVPLLTRLRYWLRPFDGSLDRQRWRWSKPGCVRSREASMRGKGSREEVESRG